MIGLVARARAATAGAKDDEVAAETVRLECKKRRNNIVNDCDCCVIN